MSENNKEINNILIVVMLLCAGMLLLAMANMPSAYYKILRLVVFAGGTIGAINAAIRKQYLWTFLLAAPAIVFNPLVPIYLYDPQKWVPFDVGGVVVFVGRGITVLTKKT
jgi:hypothetical protein